ncbi:MAG: HD domain-containing protein [Atopobiaceae bacterium]|nr:HD domain-containing protein [Atopobiaceae bacterium]
MAIDREHAQQAFEQYVSDYDARDPKIALKIDHTYRVATLCDRIARADGMGPTEADLAWLTGLLHDIGRFEQVRRYGTFNDAASVSHAALGAKLLFEPYGPSGNLLIRSFVEQSCDDELIRTAVALHSSYRLPDDLDGETRRYCDILRDADKIDIVRVNCICPIEDIYGVSESDMVNSELSDACVDTFYQHLCLPRSIRKHPADIMLGHICFAWELVHPASIDIVREQGHLADMLDRGWARPATQAKFDAMGRHMRQELGI